MKRVIISNYNQYHDRLGRFSTKENAHTISPWNGASSDGPKKVEPGLPHKDAKEEASSQLYQKNENSKEKELDLLKQAGIALNEAAKALLFDYEKVGKNTKELWSLYSSPGSLASNPEKAWKLLGGIALELASIIPAGKALKFIKGAKYLSTVSKVAKNIDIDLKQAAQSVDAISQAVKEFKEIASWEGGLLAHKTEVGAVGAAMLAHSVQLAPLKRAEPLKRMVKTGLLLEETRSKAYEMYSRSGPVEHEEISAFLGSTAGGATSLVKSYKSSSSSKSTTKTTQQPKKAVESRAVRYEQSKPLRERKPAIDSTQKVSGKSLESRNVQGAKPKSVEQAKIFQERPQGETPKPFPKRTVEYMERKSIDQQRRVPESRPQEIPKTLESRKIKSEITGSEKTQKEPAQSDLPRPFEKRGVVKSETPEKQKRSKKRKPSTASKSFAERRVRSQSSEPRLNPIFSNVYPDWHPYAGQKRYPDWHPYAKHPPGYAA